MNDFNVNIFLSNLDKNILISSDKYLFYYLKS